MDTHRQPGWAPGTSATLRLSSQRGDNGFMVSNAVDLRRFPRVNVEEGYHIQFQAGDRWYFGLPVTTLGGGGCCFRVSVLLVKGLRRDAILTRVCIEHPGIPQFSQQAKISWVQDLPRSHEEPFVLVGIEYLDPDLTFLQAVDRCIAELMKRRLSN